MWDMLSSFGEGEPFGGFVHSLLQKIALNGLASAAKATVAEISETTAVETTGPAVTKATHSTHWHTTAVHSQTTG